jgi:four helix bundle protein
MAMGSADEARLWCDYAADLEYVRREASLAWQDEFSQIARMLHGLRDSLSEN